MQRWKKGSGVTSSASSFSLPVPSRVIFAVVPRWILTIPFLQKRWTVFQMLEQSCIWNHNHNHTIMCLVKGAVGLTREYGFAVMIVVPEKVLCNLIRSLKGRAGQVVIQKTENIVHSVLLMESKKAFKWTETACHPPSGIFYRKLPILTVPLLSNRELPYWLHIKNMDYIENHPFTKAHVYWVAFVWSGCVVSESCLFMFYVLQPWK